MILSYVHNFVFVKTRKTGGTSVEIALSAICGGQDIISLITPIDEYIRLEEGRACQNFLSNHDLERDYIELLRKSTPPLRKVPKEVKDAQVFYNHMPISEILTAADIDPGSFFKFTIERHPYEKAVSYANFNLRYRTYTLGKPMHVDLEEIPPAIDRLIESGKLEKKIKNHNLYTLDGEVAVDRIIRYERLHTEYQEIMRELNLPADIPLPTVKAGLRDKDIPAKDILAKSQKTWIQEICLEEFNIMGYEY